MPRHIGLLFVAQLLFLVWDLGLRTHVFRNFANDYRSGPQRRRRYDFFDINWRWLLFKTFRNLQVKGLTMVIMVALTVLVGVFSVFIVKASCKCLERRTGIRPRFCI